VEVKDSRELQGKNGWKQGFKELWLRSWSWIRKLRIPVADINQWRYNQK
jgi:hypothetical protein